jgi:hypothetical protein
LSKSIPKKRSNVKRDSKKNQRRYTQKVDSLGRRYTTDNETGKRVSNILWENERATTRKKAKTPKKKSKAKASSKSIPRNTKPAKPKAKVRPKTKVKKAVVEDIPKNTPAVHPNLVGFDWSTLEPEEDDDSFLWEKTDQEAELEFRAEQQDIRDKERIANAEEFIPPSRIKGFGSNTIKDRAEQYKKVKIALQKATAFAALERNEVMEAAKLGRPPARDEYVRGRFLLALEQDEDIEAVVNDLADIYDYDAHDIYEIYFSPEVA